MASLKINFPSECNAALMIDPNTFLPVVRFNKSLGVRSYYRSGDNWVRASRLPDQMKTSADNIGDVITLEEWEKITGMRLPRGNTIDPFFTRPRHVFVSSLSFGWILVA